MPVSRTHEKSTGHPPCHRRGSISVGASAGSTPSRATGAGVQLTVVSLTVATYPQARGHHRRRWCRAVVSADPERVIEHCPALSSSTPMEADMTNQPGFAGLPAAGLAAAAGTTDSEGADDESTDQGVPVGEADVQADQERANGEDDSESDDGDS